MVLKEAMERWDDATPNIVSPDPGPRSVVRILGKQVRRVLREGFFEEFTQNRAFIERLVLVLQSRNKTAGIEIEQRLWLMVRVYLNVLVRYTLFFESYPDSLDERAKPSRIELQGVLCRVRLSPSATLLDSTRATEVSILP